MSEPDTLFVLAASYDDVAAAEADYEAVKALYHAIQTSHEFDAAVIARDEDGKIEVVKKHEQPTRHGAAHGLGWGLAIGAVCAILPECPARRARGRRGRRRGDRRGHRSRAGRDGRQRPQGARRRLGQGQAGLIVVYATNMADQVAANIKAVNRFVSKEIDANADALAKQLQEAEAAS